MVYIRNIDKANLKHVAFYTLSRTKWQWKPFFGLNIRGGEYIFNYVTFGFWMFCCNIQLACVHRYQTYSYTTKVTVVNGEEVVKYDKRNQYCNCGARRILKGETSG